MLVIFFGSILFALEYDPLDNSGYRVPDITTSWWMMLVTMTTVGVYAIRPHGREPCSFAAAHLNARTARVSAWI